MSISLAAVSQFKDITYLETNININKIREFTNYLFIININNDSYIQIPSDYIKKHFGKNYKMYIKFMVSSNIIKVSNSYRVNDYTKRYKINIDNIEDINKYLLNDQLGLSDIQKNIDGVYEYMFNTLSNIKIDYSDAVKDIMSLNCNDVTRQHLLYAANALKCHNYYVKTDKRGRFYCNISSLKKSLRRNYLTYKNQQLVEIDIPNSQCLFLHKWMNESGVRDEVFIEDIKTQTVYNKLQSHKQIGRKDAKTAMYIYMFGPTYMVDYFLSGRYKKVTKFLVKKKKELLSYKEVAYILQKMEADFVFKTVAPILIEQEIPFVTIHDSFIVPKNFAARTREILDSKLKEII